MAYEVKDNMVPVRPESAEWHAERVRTGIMGETSKARPRRLREGFFKKYAPADRPGVDIGCSDDPLNQTFRRWDLVLGDGDATEMAGVPAGAFWTVYASHVLEHLSFPRQALRRWWEILHPGGHLIVCVPHRDLYERRRMLPSRWNEDHKYFWLPDCEEAPCTKSLKGEIAAAVPAASVVSLRVLDEGYDHTLPDSVHPVGEFSIEAILLKE